MRHSPRPGVREPSEVSAGPQGPLLFAEGPLPETLAAIHTGSPSGTAPTTALTLEADVRRSPSPGVREPSEVSAGPQGPLLFAEVPLPETHAAAPTVITILPSHVSVSLGPGVTSEAKSTRMRPVTAPRFSPRGRRRSRSGFTSGSAKAAGVGQKGELGPSPSCPSPLPCRSQSVSASLWTSAVSGGPQGPLTPNRAQTNAETS